MEKEIYFQNFRLFNFFCLEICKKTDNIQIETKKIFKSWFPIEFFLLFFDSASPVVKCEQSLIVLEYQFVNL